MSVPDRQVPGVHLVRNEGEPVPYGQTTIGVSVIVHHYSFGWVCAGSTCQSSLGTTRPECEHIAAAKIAVTKTKGGPQ